MKKVVVAACRNEALTKEAACESTPSWASDHNYNAVKPERTAAPWPPLLYKCMYHLGLWTHLGFLHGRPLGPVQSWEL